MSNVNDITFLSLSSGSCGNCFLLKCGKDAIMIDAGVGIRSVERWLSERDIDIAAISAIVITHDHIDHSKAVGSLSKKYGMRVYTTEATFEAIARRQLTTALSKESVSFISVGRPFRVGAFSIEAFALPHDAAETIGYRITIGDRVVVFMTDLGELPSSAVKHIAEATHLVIESNYDDTMLANSCYPISLQQRISSGYGHMSNTQTSRCLSELYHRRLRNIWLCHLSEECNTPTLALNATLGALSGIGVGESDVEVVALPRKEPSKLYVIK